MRKPGAVLLAAPGYIGVHAQIVMQIRTLPYRDFHKKGWKYGWKFF
jgi:hypothetical protein